MLFKQKKSKRNLATNRDWKEKNSRYLKQLQKFLDSVDAVGEESLKKHIINQMLKCDLVLTELAEKEIEKYKSYD